MYLGWSKVLKDSDRKKKMGTSLGDAEAFLQERVPNFETERILVVVEIAIAFVVFWLLIPVLGAEPIQTGVSAKKSSSEDDDVLAPSKSTTTTKGGKKSKKSSKQQRTKDTPEESSTSTAKDDVIPPQYKIDHRLTAKCIITSLFMFVWILVSQSPDNYFVARGVFQAPLFTREETQQILQMANAAAQSNFEKAKSLNESSSSTDEMDKVTKGLLEEPVGWQKLRHAAYPTTDLNLVADPFSDADRDYIQSRLDARLAPLIQRLYGIPPAALRARDMFVVRYDTGKRTHLANHTDAGYISFNVLLDDGFEGGGTRFWNRWTEQPFAHVNPTQVGQVLLNHATINHEGVHVTSGTRTILVGFLSVDRMDLFRRKPTGLSSFATWLSFPWSTVKFQAGFSALLKKEQAKTTSEPSLVENKYMRGFLGNMHTFLNQLLDCFATHFDANLVADENRLSYLAALDDQFAKEKGQVYQANWWKGQHIKGSDNRQGPRDDSGVRRDHSPGIGEEL